MKSQEIFLFFFIFLPLFSVENSRSGLVNRLGSFSALWDPVQGCCCGLYTLYTHKYTFRFHSKMDNSVEYLIIH